MGFSLRRDRSAVSQARIASRLVWLSITILSGRPCRFSARARKRFAAVRFRALAEPKLYCVAVDVNRAVQVHLTASDFEVGIVDMPFRADRPLATVEPLQQFWRVANNPPMNGGVIKGDAALGIFSSLA